jgi:hypothetical protein
LTPLLETIPNIGDVVSSFSWLDYAESDRRAAMDVIDLFRDVNRVVELTTSSKREGFSTAHRLTRAIQASAGSRRTFARLDESPSRATFSEANYRNYMPDLSSIHCDAE